MKRRLLVAILAVMATVAFAMPALAGEGTTKTLKIQSLKVTAPDGTSQSRVDYLNATIQKQLIDGGAQMDGTGFDIKVKVMWEGARMSLTAQAVDQDGRALAVAVNHVNMFYNDEQFSDQAARKFARQAIEQATAQEATRIKAAIPTDAGGVSSTIAVPKKRN